MMTTRKRMAIIGAGISGIVSMRSVLEENMEPVCFERSSHHGGLWRYHDEDIEGQASVMKTTVINNSKEIGCLSNHIPSEDLPNFMHNTDVFRLLENMMKERDMFQYVRYNKEVVKVEFTEDYQQTGRYNLTIKDTRTGEMELGVFDGVLICTGHHVYPNWITFPGQEKFKGNIIHTHSLKKVDDSYLDKTVVIVGIGNSGVDAAVQMSNKAKKVYLSTRRGAWIFSRLGYRGMPTDAQGNRRCVSILQQLLPYSWFCWAAEQYVQMRFDHSLFNLKPEHRIFSQHPTVSDELPVKLICGTVQIKKNIESFEEDGVVFEGDTEVIEVDCVVLATGYKIKFPFLGKEVTSVKKNEVHLYKFMYPPHLPHSTLVIIGLVQSLGALFPVVEAQSRLAAYVLSGRVKLPAREEMEADIAICKEELKRRYISSPRHHIQSDFVSYLDEINDLFGARPNLFKLFFDDFELWWALMFGPHLAYQYRLQGPHPWPRARDAILSYKQRLLRPLQSQQSYKGSGSKEKSANRRITLLAIFASVLSNLFRILNLRGMRFLMCLFFILRCYLFFKQESN